MVFELVRSDGLRFGAGFNNLVEDGPLSVNWIAPDLRPTDPSFGEPEESSVSVQPGKYTLVVSETSDPGMPMVELGEGPVTIEPGGDCPEPPDPSKCSSPNKREDCGILPNPAGGS